MRRPKTPLLTAQLLLAAGLPALAQVNPLSILSDPLNGDLELLTSKANS